MPRTLRILTLVIGLGLSALPAWAQTTYDAAYLYGRVKELPENKPGKLDVSDAENLQFTWEKGSWKVPFAQIKTVYVVVSRRSVMYEMFGVPGKKRKLLLSLTLGEEGKPNRNCVFFIQGEASPEFWKTLESRTGRKPIFESEEARKAAQVPE
jgi:hypothetical protein